jgi:flavorubredoxin
MNTLFRSDGHLNAAFHDLGAAGLVQANQHVIVSGGEAMLLDPGGHKVYTQLLARIAAAVPARRIRYLFLSHQDPDVVAAVNGWLLVTGAEAYISEIWARFVTHFGIADEAAQRFRPIPDAGMVLPLGDTALKIVPAHFLHSAGNFHVYDPVSRILYSGDLGASMGAPYDVVADFDAHVPHMLGFHQRFMPSRDALRHWARMVRGLDVETLAPQHGAILRGREMVARFLDWVEQLPCGVELFEGRYVSP